MAKWRRRTKGSLPVTHHGHAEINNAIGLAVFRGWLSSDDANDSWNWLEDDFKDGHLHKADILWRSALTRAAKLSRARTSKLGTRSLDVLHVACAMELKCRYFLTFDERQNALAIAVGLKSIQL